MKNNSHLYYLSVGIGLIALLPVAESAGLGVERLAVFLVAGYWVLLGVYFSIVFAQRLFTEFEAGLMIYNIWLFLSLMAVAVGVLAILDVGVEGARWGVGLVVYGSVVGYLNRHRL